METIPAWQLTKVRNKKEVINEERIQEQKKEDRVVSKSRPAAMNLSAFIATSSSTASSPIASKSPGMPIASGKADSKMSIEPNSFDAASLDTHPHHPHTCHTPLLSLFLFVVCLSVSLFSSVCICCVELCSGVVCKCLCARVRCCGFLPSVNLKHIFSGFSRQRCLTKPFVQFAVGFEGRRLLVFFSGTRFTFCAIQNGSLKCFFCRQQILNPFANPLAPPVWNHCVAAPPSHQHA